MKRQKHTLSFFPSCYRTTMEELKIELLLLLNKITEEDPEHEFKHQIGNIVLEHLETDWNITDYSKFKRMIAKQSPVFMEITRESIVKTLTNNKENTETEKRVLIKILGIKDKEPNEFELLLVISGKMLSYIKRCSKLLYEQNSNTTLIYDLLNDLRKDENKEKREQIIKGFRTRFGIISRFKNYQDCYNHLESNYLDYLENGVREIENLEKVKEARAKLAELENFEPRKIKN